MENDQCEKCMAKDVCAATDYSVERLITMMTDVLNISNVPIDISIAAVTILQERLLAHISSEVSHADA